MAIWSYLSSTQLHLVSHSTPPMSKSRPPLAGIALGVALVAAFACGSAPTMPVTTVPGDNRSRTVQTPIGSELRIVLGNVGGGTFESPPIQSAALLRFLGDSVIPPYTPAGPTQQFRFAAVSVGTVIIHFRRILDGTVIGVVEDTVQIHE